MIDRICAEAGRYLRPGGVLLLIHSSVCGEAATIESLQARGLETSVSRRHRGRLGPLLRARADLLERDGLCRDGFEELLVIRAQRPVQQFTRRDAVERERPAG